MHAGLCVHVWSPLSHLWGMNRQELSVLLKDSFAAYVEIHGHNICLLSFQSCIISAFIYSWIHTAWKACHNTGFCKVLHLSNFSCFFLGKQFFLTALTLWKAKYTQLKRFGGQSRHSKTINKTTAALHRGSKALPRSILFLNSYCSFSQETLKRWQAN